MGANPGAFEEPGRRVSPKVAADAAMWVARLHGPSRSRQMERDCQAWLAASEEHRIAFERCTEVWQEIPRLSPADIPAGADGSRTSAPVIGWRWAVAAGLAGIVVLGGLYLRTPDGHYATSVGEYRQVLLGDGSRMSLNTSTTARVEMSSNGRTVTMETGEALFEVAKDPLRPFVVRVGGHEVRALGTTFSVRFTPATAQSKPVSVTLIEGKVTVTTADANPSEATPVALAAGDRVRLADQAAPRLDRPRVEQATSWTRGEVSFDDVSLREAIAEVNRYSRTPIALEDEAALAGLRVSGVYRSGDSRGFATAVAALHGLALLQKTDRWVLALVIGAVPAPTERK